MNKQALCSEIVALLEKEEERKFGTCIRSKPSGVVADELEQQIAAIQAVALEKSKQGGPVHPGSLVRIENRGLVFMLPFVATHLPKSIDGTRIADPFEDSVITAFMGRRPGDTVQVPTLFEGVVTLKVTSVR